MAINISSEIIIKFSDKKLAQVYLNSLNPESKEKFSHRSSIKLTLIDNNLKILIASKDVTAFRATINSYLNWIRIIDGIVEITK
ncbi:MAG: KEOPS complex subunit Pcc1 [Candidatus Hodarchaeota archaeon]